MYEAIYRKKIFLSSKIRVAHEMGYNSGLSSRAERRSVIFHLKHSKQADRPSVIVGCQRVC